MTIIMDADARAFSDGWDAYAAKKKRVAPSDLSPALAQAWLDGWDAAKEAGR